MNYIDGTKYKLDVFIKYNILFDLKLFFFDFTL